MNRTRIAFLAILLAAFTAGAGAAPLTSTFTYQGWLLQEGGPVGPTADLRFELVDEFDVLVPGAPQNQFLDHPVTDGLFTAELDFGVLPFEGQELYLRISVRVPPGAGGWTALSPNQRVAPAPYALQSRGLFVDEDLNVGVGTIDPQARFHVDGIIHVTGFSRMNFFHQLNPDIPTVSIDGDYFGGSVIDLRESDGSTRIRQRGDIGQMLLNEPSGAARVLLESGGTTTEGGTIAVRNGENVTTLFLDGDPDDGSDDGGRVSVRNASGEETVALAGSQFNGRFELKDANGQIDVSMDASTTGGGDIEINNASGDERIVLAGSQGGDNGGYIWMRQADGGTGVIIDAEANGNGSGLVSVRNSASIRETVALIGEASADIDGQIEVRNGSGVTQVQLSALDDRGSLSLGQESPLATIHAEYRDIGVGSAALNQDDVVIEDTDAVLGLYSNSGGNWASGVVLGRVNASGTLVEKWGMVARTAGELRFTHGTDPAQTGNPWIMRLNPDGTTKVKVIEILGADVAEKFPTSEHAEPGTVMEIDPANPGTLRVARGAYNRRVAGIVSGAGDLPVGAVLGNLPGSEDSPPIALSGRVWVYCDATGHAIEPGDLLTTSNTPGHAMKVTDHDRAPGAVLGKAMTPLAKGERGLVLVLVSLQ